MSTIPLSLPDELLEFIETHVEAGRFSSANDFIVALIDAARSKRSAIESLLLEGLNSGPAEEWTSQEWADMKQRLVQRQEVR